MLSPVSNAGALKRSNALDSTSKCNAPYQGVAISRTYLHLSSEDRAVIMIERQNGSSQRSTAQRLSRSTSTLSRKLQRADPAPTTRRYRPSIQRTTEENAGVGTPRRGPR